MREKIVSTLHTLHSVAEDRNGLLETLHFTLHTLHKLAYTPAQPMRAYGGAAPSQAYCPVITTIQSFTPSAAQYRLDSSSFSISARFVRSAALTSSRTAAVPSAWQM